jgi:hypothetical protein
MLTSVLNVIVSGRWVILASAPARDNHLPCRVYARVIKLRTRSTRERERERERLRRNTMSNIITQFPPGYLEESRQRELYTESIVFIVITTIITALRFVSKHIARVKWRIDDTLIVLSWGFYICFISLIIGMFLVPPRRPRISLLT